MNQPKNKSARWATVLLITMLVSSGCTLTTFLGYKRSPDFPVYMDGEVISLPGLDQPVQLAVRPDGIYQIKASTERDLARTIGYLQARDRMFQMDLMRHVARGELAALVGNVEIGGKKALDQDKFNRFAGHLADARRIVGEMDDRDRTNLDAYVQGINFWINNGQTSIEHRLLKSDIRPWEGADSLAIFRLLMFGLTHNYTREVRRLLIACDSGLDGLQRVWPTGIQFGPHILPDEAIPPGDYPIPPSIVPEMAAELPALCPDNQATPAPIQARVVRGRQIDITDLPGNIALLSHSLETSNNWVLSGDRTQSGAAIMANDPHLPHMTPPIVWGAEHQVGDRAVAGFTVPGLPYIVFGTNGDVSWGLTINNVDLQDVYVEKPAGPNAVEYDGQREVLRTKTETFEIRGEDSVRLSARFSRHGPILNDLDPFLAGRIPLASLRTVPVAGFGDSHAFRALPHVRTVTDLVDAATAMDSACLNWVAADTRGNISWSSPCLVPVRQGWLGDFPVPGWLPEYEWQETYPKDKLPSSRNPSRGWLATSNNRVLPIGRFPTPYDNDPSSPNRFVRIAAELAARTDWTIDETAKLQLDTRIEFWPGFLALATGFCDNNHTDNPLTAVARKELCDWDADMSADSIGATIYVLFAHNLLDLALADDLTGGTDGELWNYLQNIAHFETNVDWLFTRPATADVWDTQGTTLKETRNDILEAAIAAAAETASERYGTDPANWAWGHVRPFYLKHPFGGNGDGMVAELFNSRKIPGVGAPNTVFKHQFFRSDRLEMYPTAGAVLHLVVEMNGPEGARYAMAGGQNGWPKHPNYADQLELWQTGETLPLWTSQWPETRLINTTLVPGRQTERPGTDND